MRHHIDWSTVVCAIGITAFVACMVAWVVIAIWFTPGAPPYSFGP